MVLRRCESLAALLVRRWRPLVCCSGPDRDRLLGADVAEATRHAIDGAYSRATLSVSTGRAMDVDGASDSSGWPGDRAVGRGVQCDAPHAGGAVVAGVGRGELRGRGRADLGIVCVERQLVAPVQCGVPRPAGVPRRSEEQTS